MSDRESAWAYGRVPLTLTFQKEVAERLTAEVGNEQRSRLSVMSEYLTESSLKFIIKGSAFVPKPDVDVGVVKFVPRREPLIQQPYKLVEKVVRHVFCMRNKYCCRPISTLFPDMVRMHFTKKLFDMSYVFPHTRPYALTIEDYERLCNAYAEICEKYPEIWTYEYRHAGDEKRFEEFHAAKYEPFKNPENVNIRPVKMKPLDIVADELADQCSEEMVAESLLAEDDDYMYENKVVEQSGHNLQ
jgi:dimethyladenosine transferase 1